jgi:ribonuclease HI
MLNKASSATCYIVRSAMKTVSISTDGACIGNPGPGGWACILRFGNVKKEMFGSEPETTNNRMELTAVIEALKALKEPCRITLYTDSQYVKRGITEWLSEWKARGWIRREKGRSATRAVLNQDLWMELDRLIEPHHMAWAWVKGHGDHADNVRCDFLARKAAQEQIASRHSPAPSVAS